MNAFIRINILQISLVTKMASYNSEYYASNDETKDDSLDCRESYPSRSDIIYCMIKQQYRLIFLAWNQHHQTLMKVLLKFIEG